MIPYYEKDGVTIYCGDNVKTMREAIPDDSIDLTVTSPPYDNLRTYNGYTWDFEGVAAELWRVTKPGGVVVWVVGDATINGSETGTSFRQALHFMGLGFNCETMIYEVAGTGAKGSNYYYWQSFEYMFIFSKGQPKTANRIADVKNSEGGRLRRIGKKVNIIGSRTSRRIKGPEQSVRPNVWRYTNAGNDITDHEAPFPEALARDHIKSWSNPGDIVFDPFLGSGTTAKMALKLDRKCIGVDLSQEYCDIAVERLNKARADLGQSHTVNVNGVEAKQGAMFE